MISEKTKEEFSPPDVTARLGWVIGLERLAKSGFPCIPIAGATATKVTRTRQETEQVICLTGSVCV
ncbi:MULTISPECIES: hypothetical protein [unclassified Bradyrhizobium]|uniref:hypothetical protein n=1 Tax=unclassified Bradyrhizobium TaxID=2631580 RepID=UPI002916ED97|nr:MULTISPECIES: hypothetical protein [unclassified Bradyrhizobium]